VGLIVELETQKQVNGLKQTVYEHTYRPSILPASTEHLIILPVRTCTHTHTHTHTKLGSFRLCIDECDCRKVPRWDWMLLGNVGKWRYWAYKSIRMRIAVGRVKSVSMSVIVMRQTAKGG
jgi:hypothetical protein